MLLKKLDNLGQLFEIPKLLTGPLLLVVFLKKVYSVHYDFCGQTLEEIIFCVRKFWDLFRGRKRFVSTIIIVSVRLGKNCIFSHDSILRVSNSGVKKNMKKTGQKI